MKIPPPVLRSEVSARTREAVQRVGRGDVSPEPMVPPRPEPLPVIRGRNELALGSTAEGLPVLQAFREFLEAERRRARNRMLLLGAAFGLTTLLLVSALLIVGLSYFKRVKGEVGAIRSDMLAIKNEAMTVRDDAATRLEQLAVTAEKLQTGRQADQEALRGEVDERMAAYNRDMEDVKKLILLLRRSQTDIQKSITEIEERERPAPADETVMGSIERQQARYADTGRGDEPAAPITGAIEEKTPESPRPAARPLVLMDIRPRNRDNAVTWRLPIPE